MEITNNNLTFRYKFSENVVESINAFAILHKNDDRKSYKTNWGIWCEKNKEIIECETRRLKNIGYDGDVLDKMYKAGRYYFRKKSKVGKKTEPQDKPKPDKKRRIYMSLTATTLKTFDDDIKEHINDDDFRPVNGYNMFLKNYSHLLKDECVALQTKHNVTDKEVYEKFKKTYNNRYFKISRANNTQ